MARSGLIAVTVLIASLLGFVPPTLATPRPTIGRGALNAPGELQDSIPGREVAAVDPRTGAPMHIAARRVSPGGSLDEAWQPDSAFAARAALGGHFRSSRDPAGGTFVTWTEERGDAGTIRLMRLGSDGRAAEGWPRRGVVVCSGPGSRYAPEVAADGENGAFVAWTDFRSGGSRVRVTRMEPGGTPSPGWPAIGIGVSPVASEQSNAQLIADASGCATVVWEDRRTGPIRLYAQGFDASGQLAAGWPAEGLPLDSLGSSSSDVRLLAAGEAGTLATWQRRTPTTGALLMAALVPPGADWPATCSAPLALASDASDFGEPAAIAQGEGSVTVVWSEWRGGAASLRAQSLGTPGLDPRWTPGGVMIHEGEVSRAPPALAALDDTTLAIAVQGHSTPLESDVFVHALGPNGAPPAGWPAEGLAACVARGDQHHPWISPDGAGGLLVSWLDARPSAATGAASRVLASRPSIELVSAHATPGRARIIWRARTWIEGRVSAERRLGEGEWEKLAALAPDDSACLVLDDRSVPDGVHAEYRLAIPSGRNELHSAVVALDIPAAPKVLTLHRVRSLGREQALLVSFALPRGEAPRLDLLDVQGRRMFEERIEGLEPGEHKIRWRLPNRVPSGVYFLRLLQGGAERTAKVPFIR